MSPGLFSPENYLERSFSHGDHILAIFSKQVSFSIPFTEAEFTWGWPSAIWIQYADGSEQVFQITDPTRKAVLLILGGAVTGTVLFALLQALGSKASA